MFVRGVVVAAGNYSRFGFAAAWTGNFAAGWNVLADVEWRLLVANERSRADGAGDSATLARGCGGVRRIFEDDDADVPVREADFVDDSARPDDPAAEGFTTASFLNAEIPRFIQR